MSNGAPPVDLTGTWSIFNQTTLSWSIEDTITTAFTAGGMFNNDLLAASMDVAVIGGGGGGAGGTGIAAGATSPAGGGGNGAGFALLTGVSPSLFSPTVAVTVGAAGVGGQGGFGSTTVFTAPQVGTDGGNSSFGSYLTSAGGPGGTHNIPVTGGGVAASTISGATLETGGAAGPPLTSTVTPAPATTYAPSGGGGGVGGNSSGNHQAGAGGVVASLSLLGGIGGVGIVQLGGGPNLVISGGSGFPGNTAGNSSGSGGGGGGDCDFPSSQSNNHGTAGNGADGGAYGSGGGGGGTASGCSGTGSDNTGGNGGNGAPGIVMVTQLYDPPDSYNIYENGVLIGNTTNTSFVDLNPVPGLTTYSVTAVYGSTESTPDTITVLNGGTVTVYGGFAEAEDFPPIMLANLKGIKPRVYVPIQSTTVRTKQ